MTPHLHDNSPQAKTLKAVKRIANVILVCSGLFLLLEMVLVTLPKLESVQYGTGMCNVTSTKLNTNGGKQLRCHCVGQNGNSKCTIYYPCLQIFVSYNNESEREALVVKDRRQISEQCSYKLRDYDCQTKDDVYQHLESFREKWGSIPLTYQCFRASRHPDRVTLTNEAPSTSLALSMTLLPCTGIVIGLVMLHFKEQIGLMLLRKRRLDVNEGYLPLAVEGDPEGFGEPRERKE